MPAARARVGVRLLARSGHGRRMSVVQTGPIAAARDVAPAAKRPRTLPASGSSPAASSGSGAAHRQGGERARAACPSSPLACPVSPSLGDGDNLWLPLPDAPLRSVVGRPAPPDGQRSRAAVLLTVLLPPPDWPEMGRRTVQRTTSSTGWLPYAGTAAGAGPPRHDVGSGACRSSRCRRHSTGCINGRRRRAGPSRVLLLGPIRFVGETVVGWHRSGHHRGEPRAAGVGASPTDQAGKRVLARVACLER